MANHQRKIGEEEEEDAVYDVDEIVDERQGDEGLEYLLKWKGWDSKDNTWEPSEHIIDKILITKFEKKKQQQQALQLKNKKRVVKKKVIPLKSVLKNTYAVDSSSNDEASDNNDVLDYEDDDDLSTLNTSTNAGKSKAKKRAAVQSKRLGAKQRKKVTIIDHNEDSDESDDEAHVKSDGEGDDVSDDEFVGDGDEVSDDDADNESDDKFGKEPADIYPDKKEPSKKGITGFFGVISGSITEYFKNVLP